MTYTITITSRPCKKTDDLLALLPTIEKAYPAVKVEVELNDHILWFPKTVVTFTDDKGQEKEQAVLYGFRNETQHMMFLSSVLDVDWHCRLAS